ncbi:MAG: ABC transporter ATP-binding protein [Phycisphaerales bacterium]|nr:ABC transporter ATP-binding protein [Phycisphaerales bacterium]
MLRLEHVRKTFGTLVAVDDLSLEIQPGEIFGLLGPNGAGKTTTVNMGIGLLAPDAGRVELVGYGAPTVPAVRARLGVAPQSLALYEELTGEQNLAFFGELYGLRGRMLAERVHQALDFVELYERRSDQVRKYSGGMKRRLNLAAAIVHRPALLICDEPTVGVDPQSRNAILENILALRADGCTVIYTTHYMEEAQRVCDRVAIVDHGRLLALDTVSALIAQHCGADFVLAETAEGEQRIETDDPVATLGELQRAGKLRRFRVYRPDLESVFLKLTGRTLRD